MSRADIAAEAAHLEPGDQIRTVCPFCGGGTSGEKSLSIKLDSESGLILYHCFRGNCGEAGVLGGSKLGKLYTYKAAEPKKKPPFDDSSIFGLGGEDDAPSYAAITKINSWGLGLADYRWGYDTNSQRLAIPVWGPLHELRGFVLRAIFDWQKPKSLTGVIRREDPFIAWIDAGMEHGPIIVVEDIPSAIRVAKCGYDAVALNGNSPSEAALDELRTYSGGGVRKVVFAFDPDATGQAIRVLRQYGLRGNASVLVLQQDFKNMTDKEATDWLKNVT